jgi:DNA-binding NtrC family response regulator
VRILIVDDDPPLRRAIVRGFQIQGHEVSDAASAEAAVVLFDEGYVPEAVVSDNSMGAGMKGYVFLSDVVRRRFPKAKYVLVSGDVWVADHAVVAGIPFLPKPCSHKQLNEVLGLSVS